MMSLFNEHYRIERLQDKLERLQKHVTALTLRLEEQERRNKGNSKAIEHIEEVTGIEQPELFRLYDLSPEPSHKEIKAFNLSEKVNAILQHLGLTESAKQPNKLIPAPKKKASK